jgi:hypothetical protein
LRRRLPTALVALPLAALMLSCTPTAFLNVTVTRRGNITIGFINNTPFRANFTFGGYDPQDQNTVPVFSQLRLEGNTAAQAQNQGCRRVFTIGGSELIRLIRFQGLNVADAPVLHEDVFFSNAPANDPLSAEPTEGRARQRTLRNGVDYICAGVLVFEFVPDLASPDGFRIDYTFLTP